MQYISKSERGSAAMIRAVAKQLWDAGLPVLDDLHTGGGAKSPAEKRRRLSSSFAR